ncbi:MAG: hypothetical protein ACRCU6_07855 [Fusobacteriaceae bacterium]
MRYWKRFLQGTLLLTVLAFTACTSALDTVSDLASSISISIPESVKTAALGRVNQELELYAIGGANLGDGGITFANSRALKNSREKLREEIRKESEIQIRSYISNQDNYTKKIITPIIPDMVEYIVEAEIGRAQERGFWDDGRRSYALLSLNRKDVKIQSERVFNGYIKDLSNRIKATVVAESE